VNARWSILLAKRNVDVYILVGGTVMRVWWDALSSLSNAFSIGKNACKNVIMTLMIAKTIV
jgi:hypothetical protein